MNTFPKDAPVDDIVASLKTDGYAIVTDVLNTHDLTHLNKQIAIYIDTVFPDSGNTFMGGKTKRFGRLLLRIPKVREIIQDNVVLSVLDKTLLKYSPTYQVHFTGVMHVMEYEKAQVLHRDISPFPNPGPSIVLATMWAASDFTRQNGATVFVPGSHLWLDGRVPVKSELMVAEMSAGSVLLYAGNLIHGAGSCKSGYRTGVSLQYCVGWMRQEENQYLAVPQDVARGFSVGLKKLMGYDLAARHWGYVDQTHPLDFLNQKQPTLSLDPTGYEFPGRVTMLHTYEGDVHHEQRYDVTLDD